jgi:hypothetical protein
MANRRRLDDAYQRHDKAAIAEAKQTQEQLSLLDVLLGFLSFVRD